MNRVLLCVPRKKLNKPPETRAEHSHSTSPIVCLTPFFIGDDLIFSYFLILIPRTGKKDATSYLAAKN